MIDSRGAVDRRYRDGAELIGLTPSTPELLADEIDGQLYAYKREKQCRVCQLPPDLMEIVDTMLVHGSRYADVLRLISPSLADRGLRESQLPSYNSIRNHQKRHLPYDKLAVRQIVERRAEQAGKSILEGTGRLLTYEAVLELVVQRGFEALADKDIEPSVSETLAAAGRLESVERETAGGVTVQELLTQLNIVLRVVQDVVPRDYWEEIRVKIREARAQMELPVETVSVGGE